MGFFIIRPRRPELLIRLSNFSFFSALRFSSAILESAPSSNLRVLLASEAFEVIKLTLSFCILAMDLRALAEGFSCTSGTKTSF